MELISRVGAERLAKEIREFWLKQGGLVQTEVSKCSETVGKDVSGGYIYEVRTDMVGGLPVWWK
jgi:hypothetical protein